MCVNNMQNFHFSTTVDEQVHKNWQVSLIALLNILEKMATAAMQNSTQDGDFELSAAIEETNSQGFKKLADTGT